MTCYVLKVRWTTVCLPCKHEHVQVQHVAPGVTFRPPPPPLRCEKCAHRLSRDEHSWLQKFEVEEVEEVGE